MILKVHENYLNIYDNNIYQIVQYGNSQSSIVKKNLPYVNNCLWCVRLINDDENKLISTDKYSIFTIDDFRKNFIEYDINLLKIEEAKQILLTKAKFTPIKDGDFTNTYPEKEVMNVISLLEEVKKELSKGKKLNIRNNI